jgi:hypothetical protein
MKSFFVGLSLIFLVTGVFFKDVFLSGKVLLPGDIVVGMYYPWLSEKWGYQVGVPVKNPIISDVVSAVYIWKKLAVESFRQGGLPLWNPYSYSGYPLMANFQSGSLYPFNTLMILFGDTAGWNAMLIGGVLGGAVAMFLFLKNKGMSSFAASAAAISYALSAYAVTWMEFVTTAQMMVWFPLMFLSVDLAIKGKTLWRLMWPAVLYMAITAGRFEVLVYMLFAVGAYGIAISLEIKKWKWIREFILLGMAGLLMGAVQIWPTVEMSFRSIRFEESYIAEQRWGLIPFGQLITGLAPDFFGNPATGNYWGRWHYHETVFYTGVTSIVALFSAFMGYKRLKKYKFFLGMAIVGLLLGLDSPVGELIYRAKIPVLSTVSAGRVFVLFVTGAAVLIGWWIDNIREFSWGLVARSVVYPLLGIAVSAAMVWLLISPESSLHLMVAMRNLVFPSGLVIFIGGALMLRKTKLFVWMILAIVMLDLIRSGWKYLPMVEQRLVFPKEQTIQFLTEESSKDIFRIDREHGEIMPPNMWAMYGLMSPSGYDPLAPKDYVTAYSKDLNMSKPVISRYSELQKYDAEALGEYNVKYLLALKRDEEGKIPGSLLNKRIDLAEWKKVKETNEVVILENNKYQSRVRVSGGGFADLTEYTSGRAMINYGGVRQNQKIILAEAYYPGWKYCEEGKCNAVEKEGPFMAGKVFGSEGKMTFVFRPESFKNGLVVTLGTMAGWIGYVVWKSRKFC